MIELNRKEIATVMKVSGVTIDNWRRKGMPFHRPNNLDRCVFFFEECYLWRNGKPAPKEKIKEVKEVKNSDKGEEYDNS